MAKPLGSFAKLPLTLEYLIEPALKYGVYQDDARRSTFLKHATSQELGELSQVAERYRLNEHHELVADFFDAYPITEHPDSAKLYWLFCTINDAGFPLSPDNWNTIENHIRELGRFGTFRLASERAFAARFLADFGRKARAAIPYLRVATRDEDLRVRVWAYYALAVIEGKRAENEKAVRSIYSKHSKKDKDGYHVDDIGSEASEVLKKFRQL